jgi:hypothetical protein
MVNLYDLGQPFFGKHGDAMRQSVNIKAVVRQRLAASSPAPSQSGLSTVSGALI